MKTTVSSGASGRAGGPAAAGGLWEGGREGCSPRYRCARPKQEEQGGLQLSLTAGRGGRSARPAGEAGGCKGCAGSLMPWRESEGWGEAEKGVSA